MRGLRLQEQDEQEKPVPEIVADWYKNKLDRGGLLQQDSDDDPRQQVQQPKKASPQFK
jgi:hypothetical protein